MYLTCVARWDPIEQKETWSANTLHLIFFENSKYIEIFFILSSFLDFLPDNIYVPQ